MTGLRDFLSGGRGSHLSLLSDLRLLVILSVSSVGIFGTQVVSPALPSIADALSVSEARIGLVVSAYFLPTLLTVPLAGALADIYGRRRLMLVGLLLLGTGGVGIAFVDSFRMLLLLRVVQGIGLAGLGPITVVVIGDLYSGTRGTSAQGFRMSSHGIVQIVIPAAAGYLVSIHWNYAFLLFGAALPIFALVVLYLPETGRVDANEGRSQIADELRQYWSALRHEALDAEFLVLIAGGFTVNFLRSALMTYGPLYAVRTLGASAFVAGLLLSLRGAIRIVSSPFSGAAVSLASRKWGLVGTVVLAAAAMSLISASSTLLWLAVAFALYSLGEALFMPILNDVVTLMASDDRRGGLVSIMTVGRLVASVIGPVFFGAILSLAGSEAMFGTAGVVALCYAIAAGLLLTPALEER